jgi:hypothetical protein
MPKFGARLLPGLKVVTSRHPLGTRVAQDVPEQRVSR